MRTKDFLNKITSFGLPVSDGYDLISYILNIEYSKSKYVNDVPDNMALKIFEKLQNKIPVAYITNRREFYGREFYIDNNVLIPRVETEVLVEEALLFLKGKKNTNILDLCTGSGCILLTILSEVSDCVGLGVDISLNAISVAEKNCSNLNLNIRASFINKDVLSYNWQKDKYDIILCNPPYLSFNEYEDCDERVKKEPKIAFIASDNGLLFYKNILSKMSLLCKKDSIGLFEIGYKQKNQIEKIVSDLGLKAEFIKDLFGIDRVLKVFV